MQVYSDGTTLKDHIDPELYQEVVDALAPLGMPEEQVAQYKPWSVHPLEHGQSHGQVVLLKFVRQVIENFPLEGPHRPGALPGGGGCSGPLGYARGAGGPV